MATLFRLALSKECNFSENCQSDGCSTKKPKCEKCIPDLFSDDGKCKSYSENHCKKGECNEDGSCNECENGNYFLIHSTCLPCSEILFCKSGQCSTKEKLCKEFEERNIKFGDECQPCSFQHCNVCDNKTGGCTECEVGNYTLDDTSCIPCKDSQVLNCQIDGCSTTSLV